MGTKRRAPKGAAPATLNAAEREPFTAFPNWDAARGAMRMHSERDAGSSYGDALDGDEGTPAATAAAAPRYRVEPGGAAGAWKVVRSSAGATVAEAPSELEPAKRLVAALEAEASHRATADDEAPESAAHDGAEALTGDGATDSRQ